MIEAGVLNIPGWFDQISRVYDDEGISPTLNTNGSTIPKIEVVGDLHLERISNGGKRNNHANDVLSADGISTCITAAAGEGGGHVPKIEVVGDLHNGSVENGKVYGIDGISPALVASAGDKGNHVRVDVTELGGGTTDD